MLDKIKEMIKGKKDPKEKQENVFEKSTPNQPLPSHDPRRNTIHGSEYATADELMQKVSQDEQRRKASYSLIKSSVGVSGMDTLYKSGSGITRVRLQNYKIESIF